jgi:hypothetical protein
MNLGDAAVPLCVDLDGSLTPVDTLHESLLNLAREAIVFAVSDRVSLWTFGLIALVVLVAI